MEKRKNYLLYLGIASLGILLLFFLNIVTPFYADDYSYMFDFVTKNRIDSIDDVFRSMGIHYQKVNGRYITHLLAHLLLWGNKVLFNLLNTAVFAIMVFFMYKLGANGRKQGLLCCCTAVLAIWFCTPAFGQSYLWVTGAANYLWGLALILGFLLYLKNGESLNLPSAVKYAVSLLFGAIAANTTENASAALLIMVIGLMVLKKLRKEKIGALLCFGLVGTVLGLGAMLLAPGEFARIASNSTGIDITALVLRALKLALRYITANLPILSAIAIVIIYGVRSKKLSMEAALDAALYFLGSLAATFSLILSPASPDRALNSATVLCTICLIRLLCEVLGEKQTGIKTLVAIIMVLALLFSYLFVFVDLLGVKDKWEQREVLAHEQIDGGSCELVLPSIESDSRYSPFEAWADIESDSEDWKNVALARYFSVSSVTAQE
jgi:hypothetical protein